VWISKSRYNELVEIDFTSARFPREMVSEKLEKFSSQLDLLKSHSETRSSEPDSFLFLYSEEEIFNLASKLKENNDLERVKIVFLVGIGGANLAFKALYDALWGIGESRKESKHFIFLDSTDSLSETEADDIINSLSDASEALILIVSKSGTTLETIGNAQLVVGALEKKFGDVSGRIMAVTQKGSPLWQALSETAADLFPTDAALSDRFSAFSTTALVPLSLLDFDIISYLKGAREMRDRCLLAESQNPALVSATALHFHYGNSMRILDSFLFSPRLETLGKWYRQLGAESLGKSETLDGNKTDIGFTPTVSIGTTDLHSMLQLYLAGPKNRFTQFVRSKDGDENHLIDTKSLGSLDDTLAGKSPAEILEAIFGSVKKSYEKEQLPFLEITLETISENELGAYMMFKMMETILLGELLNVNVYNQPNVEEYKKSARHSLGL